jgi:hypothetical protein
MSLTAFVYYDALLASGTLDPSADSIAIPIFSTVMFSVVAFPVIAAITAIFLQKYPGSVSLVIWDANRPLRSFIFSSIFGVPAAVIAVSAEQDFGRMLPWYEYLWLPLYLLLVVWLLALRAAVVGQLTTVADPSNPLTR